MYAIFDVKRADEGRIAEVLSDTQDDIVSRQSISIREGAALGFPDFARLVIVEGSEAGVARAVERFSFAARLPEGKADSVYRALKAQEDEVLDGVGFLFQ